MSRKLTLYNLGPSPNSKKVRLALGLKGLDHEVIHVDPADRTAVVEISGQPLTPVLAHGDTIVFDSSAILRYLDANVKREPRLFSSDRDEMRAIEGWENWTRTELSPGVGMLFGQFFAGSTDKAVVQQAVGKVNAAARHLERSLTPSGWLVGSGPTAADVTAAAWLSLGFLTPAAAASHPILTFFQDALTIDPELQGVRRWYQALDAHDR